MAENKSLIYGSLKPAKAKPVSNAKIIKSNTINKDKKCADIEPSEYPWLDFCVDMPLCSEVGGKYENDYAFKYTLNDEGKIVSQKEYLSDLLLVTQLYGQEICGEKKKF